MTQIIESGYILRQRKGSKWVSVIAPGGRISTVIGELSKDTAKAIIRATGEKVVNNIRPCATCPHKGPSGCVKWTCIYERGK
jgi:hypothetical protein